MGIHDAEEQLFNEWKEHLKERMDAEKVERLWCPDGLHYTGTPDKSREYWSMDQDNKEEDLWKAAKIRPVFLTKDYNHQGDEEGADIREETGYRNDTDNVYHQFFGKYLTFLYGLTQMSLKDGFYPSLEEASNIENYTTNFYKVPVVRMNLKKIAGKNKCENNILQDYIQKDKDFIRRQIALYQPNVIVCCHGTTYEARWNKRDTGINPVMSMLKKFYPDMESVKFKDKESYNLYYSPTSKVIIIHEYHPSALFVSYEEYYSIIPELAEYLHENPQVIL